MKRQFETVRADAGLEEIERKLEACGADLIPVCRDGLLVGTITHQDVASRMPGVAGVMAADILFCFEDTDVTEAAKLMQESRVTQIPVLNRRRRVVGVLALKDIPGAES